MTNEEFREMRKEQQRERSKKYREKNKDKLKEQNKEYYERNKQQILYQQNKERKFGINTTPPIN